MLHLPYCEFYITHTCNLSCKDCHTFNNLPISGHSNWDAVKGLYQEWAELLDIDRISLIGGEPLLNPDFYSWLHGVSELWPLSSIKIYTNGSQFHRWPDLYRDVCKINETKPHGKIWFVVSIHDKSHRELFNQWMRTNKISAKTWYGDETKILEKIYLAPKNLFESNKFTIEDHRGIIIQLRDEEFFHTNALIQNSEKASITLHNSDPEKAIEICKVKTCHHMRDGRLYKCGPIGILPKVVNEFNVDIDADDLSLLHSYVPAETQWDRQKLAQFIDDLNLVKSIPQCKFCPQDFSYSKANPSTKKIMWQKYNKKGKSEVDLI